MLSTGEGDKIGRVLNIQAENSPAGVFSQYNVVE